MKLQDHIVWSEEDSFSIRLTTTEIIMRLKLLSAFFKSLLIRYARKSVDVAIFGVKQTKNGRN